MKVSKKQEEEGVKPLEAPPYAKRSWRIGRVKNGDKEDLSNMLQQTAQANSFQMQKRGGFLRRTQVKRPKTKDGVPQEFLFVDMCPPTEEHELEEEKDEKKQGRVSRLFRYKKKEEEEEEEASSSNLLKIFHKDPMQQGQRIDIPLPAGATPLDTKTKGLKRLYTNFKSEKQPETPSESPQLRPQMSVMTDGSGRSHLLLKQHSSSPEASPYHESNSGALPMGTPYSIATSDNEDEDYEYNDMDSFDKISIFTTNDTDSAYPYSNNSIASKKTKTNRFRSNSVASEFDVAAYPPGSPARRAPRTNRHDRSSSSLNNPRGKRRLRGNSLETQSLVGLGVVHSPDIDQFMKNDYGTGPGAINARRTISSIDQSSLNSSIIFDGAKNTVLATPVSSVDYFRSSESPYLYEKQHNPVQDDNDNFVNPIPEILNAINGSSSAQQYQPPGGEHFDLSAYITYDASSGY